MNTKQVLESYLLKGVLDKLKDVGITDEQLSNIQSDLWKPEVLEELDSWSKRYLTEGHLWGDAPSICGEFLIDELSPSSSILDLGCGYGRDSKALLEHGHRVTGVDNAMIAALEARSQLDEHIKKRNAHIVEGDIITAPIIQRNFDAVLSHRTLHLPDPKDVPAIIHRVAGVLKPGGTLVMTARSDEDFNEEQMDRINENTAVYKDRPTHRINFYNEERFESVLKYKFTDLSFQRGEEIESLGNIDGNGQPVMSQYIQVIARKKTDKELENERALDIL